MNYQKIISDLNFALDQAAACQHKQARKRLVIAEQFEHEKKQLMKRLKSATDKSTKKKVKKDLELVENGLRQLVAA